MIDATILSNLHRELNAHLTTIASTHGHATKAAHEKNALPMLLLLLLETRLNLLLPNSDYSGFKRGMKKKAQADLATTSAETTPVAGHDVPLGFSSAPGFQQQMQSQQMQNPLEQHAYRQHRSTKISKPEHYGDDSNKKHKPNANGGKKQTKNKRNKNKPKTKRRAANKKNKKAHAGRVSRHNKVFRRKTRRSK